MSQQYSSQQPQGYHNYIRNVAIIGAGGQSGQHIVNYLLQTGKHTVTAISRANSTSTFAPGVQVKNVDYDDHAALVAALTGQDAVLITMNSRAPKEASIKLVQAVADANVPWILPNEWGYDNSDQEFGKDIILGIASGEIRALIEKLGKSSWIGFACGFWYDYSLSATSLTYGFDFKNRAVTFYDDGTVKINTTPISQMGLAVSKLLSLKILPDSEDDTSATLSAFRNRYCHVASFCVSQKDMFASVLRVTQTEESEWKITHQPSQERYDEGSRQMKSGDRTGFMKVLYTRCFYPSGDGNMEAKYGLDNDKIGFEKVDLDEWTKISVDLADEYIKMGNGPLGEYR